MIGFSMRRSSHAEYVTVPANQLTPRPAKVPWEVAGSLFVAGVTAYAAVRAVNLGPGNTVVIAGAAVLCGLATFARHKDQDKLSAVLFLLAGADVYFGAVPDSGIWVVILLAAAAAAFFAPLKGPTGAAKMDL